MKHWPKLKRGIIAIVLAIPVCAFACPLVRNVFLHTGEAAAGREDYETARRRFSTALLLGGLSARGKAFAYGPLSWVHAEQGNFQEAIQFELRAQASTHNQAAPVVRSGRMAKLQSERGSWSDAAREVDSLLAHAKLFDDSPPSLKAVANANAEAGSRVKPTRTALANCYFNIGYYYYLSGDLQSALPCFERSEEIHRNYIGPDQIGARHSNLYVALTHYHLGNLASAERIAEALIFPSDGVRRWLEEDVERGSILLAMIARNKGDAPKALSYCADSLRFIRQKGKGFWRIRQAEMLDLMGSLQVEAGDLDEGKASFAESMHLREETGTASHPAYADALAGLARIAMERGDLESALKSEERALGILDASLARDHPRHAAHLLMLVAIHSVLGREAPTAGYKQRLDEVVKKPLGIYWEEFERLRVYCGKALNAAGKSEQAGYLQNLKIQRVRVESGGSAADSDPPGETGVEGPR